MICAIYITSQSYARSGLYVREILISHRLPAPKLPLSIIWLVALDAPQKIILTPEASKSFSVTQNPISAVIPTFRFAALVLEVS